VSTGRCRRGGVDGEVSTGRCRRGGVDGEVSTGRPVEAASMRWWKMEAGGKIDAR
jgi:hypothetical protein